MMKTLKRHSLVWLDPDLDLASCITDLSHVAATRGWIANGLPLVVARQPQKLDGSVTHVAVGLTLPPPAIRQRVFLHVPIASILIQNDPLLLSQAYNSVERRCQELIQHIITICEQTNVSPCVYGSALWQTISGNEYMTESSDLDVLFVCNETSNMHLLFDLLQACERSKPRLDGELFAPSGWAAAWREVTSAVKTGGLGTVLAKSTYEVRLLPLDEFFGQGNT